MGTMAEKLARVKEAEDRAAKALEEYRGKAEEIVSAARQEAERSKADAEARARSEGEAEMKRIIEEAGRSARELEERYRKEAAELRDSVARRREAAIGYVLEKLEQGE